MNVDPNLSPIALFAFNRPEHVRRTLEALARNPLAERSQLVAFSDGARNGKPQDSERVSAVRMVLRERAWCGNVTIVEAPENLGLARSIRGGVTELLTSYDRVIVMEDDLEVSPGFLTYMNEALTRYTGEERVMSVSAYLPALREAAQLPSTFFMRTATSSGWATWRRAWARHEPDAGVLAARIKQSGRLRAFNLDGGYDYFRQLELNISGRLRTWAVQWYASIFLADGLSLYPHRSLVRNFGHDGSGVHCQPNVTHLQPSLAESIPVEAIPIEPNAEARAALRRHLRGTLGRRWREGIRSALEGCSRRLRRGLSVFSFRPRREKGGAS
jgi:hypothetical protein